MFYRISRRKHFTHRQLKKREKEQRELERSIQPTDNVDSVIANQQRIIRKNLNIDFGYRQRITKLRCIVRRSMGTRKWWHSCCTTDATLVSATAAENLRSTSPHNMAGKLRARLCFFRRYSSAHFFFSLADSSHTENKSVCDCSHVERQLLQIIIEKAIFLSSILP